MEVIAFSDLHGALPEVAALPDADAVLIAGDITNIGTDFWPGVTAAQIWMEALQARYKTVLWVPGNHDIGMTPELLPGHCLLDNPVLLGSQRIAGIALSCCFDFPELKRYWVHMTDNPAVDAAAFVALPPCDVLVSHSPPLGCRDKTHSGARIGSPGLRAYIEREAPQLVLCGHCHEAHGEEWLGKTRVINLADGGRLLRL